MIDLGRWLMYEIHGRVERKVRRKHLGRGVKRNWRYRAWIRSRPSIVSGLSPCEVCHTGSDGGMGLKADDESCVPLTWREHREYHQIGRDSFCRKYGLDLVEIVRFLNTEFRKGHQ